MRLRFLPCNLVLFLLILSAPVLVRGQEPRVQASAEERLLETMHSITSRTLFGYVEELASEKYGGRLTGTPGYDAAAQWAANLFEKWNIKPAGENGTYFQSFANPYTLVLPGAEISMNLPVGKGGVVTKRYRYEDDFFPGSTSDTGEVTAEVVYVGYGITAPELGYDEYAGVDVQGKIVLVEPEVPVSPNRDPETFKKWRPYSFHDYKVKNAKAHGAAGMIYDYHIANPNCAFIKGLVLIYVGRQVVEDVFAGTGYEHRAVVSEIRSNLKPKSFATGREMTIKAVTEHHPEGTARNVIGYLEGSDPGLKNETIVIGAHLDHLGRNDRLMPGAIDNASGDAVLLGAAEALAKSPAPLGRSVLFILFGAEEQGVKGSDYYLKHPSVPNDRIKAFINLESPGRGERITGGAGKNYPELWEYFERNNRRFIHRRIQATSTANLARPRQDAAHFMWAGIPTVSFGASGAPRLPYATYHTPHDTPEVITPEIMEDLARLVFLSVVDMSRN